MLKELRYTLEEYEFDNKEIEVDLVATFECSKYIPASKYGGRDGLGWPEEGGEIELIDLEVAASPELDEKKLLEKLWKDESFLDRLEDKARDDFNQREERWD